jgi:hypothetical protein
MSEAVFAAGISLNLLTDQITAITTGDVAKL